MTDTIDHAHWARIRAEHIQRGFYGACLNLEAIERDIIRARKRGLSYFIMNSDGEETYVKSNGEKTQEEALARVRWEKRIGVWEQFGMKWGPVALLRVTKWKIPA